MRIYHSVFTLMLIIGTLCFHQAAVADAVINLSQDVAGPAVLNEDGSYTVEYIITAQNTGDVAGTYDLVLEFSPTEPLGAEVATLTYSPGGETQTGSPILSGDLVANSMDETSAPFFYEPYLIVNDEGLASGATETWSLSVIFNIQVSPASPRDRGEGGDFLNAMSVVKRP